jgi:predicted nucleic acid-binding protein
LEAWLDRELPAWFAGRVLTIDTAIAGRWGVVCAQAQMKGRPLSVVDGLLAATACNTG